MSSAVVLQVRASAAACGAPRVVVFHRFETSFGDSGLEYGWCYCGPCGEGSCGNFLTCARFNRLLRTEAQ